MTLVKGWHTGRVWFTTLSASLRIVVIYVFLFITLYKKPYLDIGKILSGGWDNVFDRN